MLIVSCLLTFLVQVALFIVALLVFRVYETHS